MKRRLLRVGLAGARVLSVLGGCFLGVRAADSDAYWDDRFGSDAGAGAIHCICLRGDTVFVGGRFGQVAGTGATNLAVWEGDRWSDLGGGIGGGGFPSVEALVNQGADLYAGGAFARAGGVAANNIARWDGVRWWPLGGGIDGLVRTMTWGDGHLYVAGTFTGAGGVATTNIARWDGTRWRSLGGGLGTGLGIDAVDAAAVSGGVLFAAGRYCLGAGRNCVTLARWERDQWLHVSQFDGVVRGLVPTLHGLVAAGAFRSVEALPAAGIGLWDRSSWTTFGSGLTTTGEVHAVVEASAQVFAGGFFSSAGGILAGNLARWDGAAWHPLGSGTDSSVRALASNGSEVFVGGTFGRVGDKVSARFGIWHIPRTLKVRQRGEALVLSWPRADSDCVLETSRSLSSPDWQPVAESPLLVENRLTVTHALAAATRFYRLRQRTDD